MIHSYLDSYTFKEGVPNQFQYKVDLINYIEPQKTYLITKERFEDGEYFSKFEPNYENVFFYVNQFFGDGADEPAIALKSDVNLPRVNSKTIMNTNITYNVNGLKVLINTGYAIIDPKRTPIAGNTSEFVIIFDYDGSKQDIYTINNPVVLKLNDFKINAEFSFNISIEQGETKSNVLDRIKNKIRKIF